MESIHSESGINHLPVMEGNIVRAEFDLRYCYMVRTYLGAYVVVETNADRLDFGSRCIVNPCVEGSLSRHDVYACYPIEASSNYIKTIFSKSQDLLT